MIKFYTKLEEVENVRVVSSLIGSSQEYEGKGIGSIINTPQKKGVAVAYDEEGIPCGFAVLNREEDRSLMVEHIFTSRGEEIQKELLGFIQKYAEKHGKTTISLYPYLDDEKAIEFYERSGFMFGSHPTGEGDYAYMTKYVDKKYNRLAQLLDYLQQQSKSSSLLSYTREQRKKRENSFIRKAEKELGFNVTKYLDTPEFIASAMFYEEMSAKGKTYLDLKKAVLFKKSQPEFYNQLKEDCPASFKHFEKWVEESMKALEAKHIYEIHKEEKERRLVAKLFRQTSGVQIPLDI